MNFDSVYGGGLKSEKPADVYVRNGVLKKGFSKLFTRYLTPRDQISFPFNPK